MSQKIEKMRLLSCFILFKNMKNKNIRNILSTNYFSLKILIKYILIKLKMFKLYNDISNFHHLYQSFYPF